MLPVLVIIFITFGSFFFALQYMAKDADEVMLKSETSVLRTQLKQVADDITVIAADNAAWRAAYENVYLNYDQKWVDDNYSKNLQVLSKLDAFFIYGVNDQIIYSKSDDDQPLSHQYLSSGLGEHLQSLMVEDLTSVVNSSGIFEVSGRLFFFGASLVQNPEGNPDIKTAPERRPAVVFVRELTERTMVNIGNNIDMEALHIHYNDTEHTGFLTMNSDLNENIFVENQNITFDWQPKNAGARLSGQLMTPLGIAALLVVLSFFYFYRRASRLFKMLEELDKMKSNFVANMSHEMRTPLNAIIGFSELLKAETFGKLEGEKNKEYVGYILESGHHLLRVINDILDLSKVEAGKMDVQEEYYRICDLVDDSLSILEPKLDQHGLIVESNIADVEIKTDAKLFKQVIENILSNAIKFTPAGGSIQISNLSKQDFVEISITDTGIGMDDDEIKTALSNFGQVENVYSREHAGTGLGLSLVKKFMKVLGGNMYVTSKKHIGTTVSLNFPVVKET